MSNQGNVVVVRLKSGRIEEFVDRVADPATSGLPSVTHSVSTDLRNVCVTARTVSRGEYRPFAGHELLSGERMVVFPKSEVLSYEIVPRYGYTTQAQKEYAAANKAASGLAEGIGGLSALLAMLFLFPCIGIFLGITVNHQVNPFPDLSSAIIALIGMILLPVIGFVIAYFIDYNAAHKKK